MTYIAAFPCREGYVCCADTLETFGHEKQYVEKLASFGDGEYPFCIGGAGVGEIIDALTQEVSERIISQKPHGYRALAECIKSAIRYVYENDVPVMALKKQHQTATLLIAANAKPLEGDFCLFQANGKRVFKIERGIIGYKTPTNHTLLKRFHDAEMPMSQAVLLAAYLVSHSKLIDEGVGGETRIGIVSQLWAKIEDIAYTQTLEAIIQDFLPIADQVFLSFADVSLSRSQFEVKLGQLTSLLQVQRRVAVQRFLGYIQSLVDRGSLSYDWPYAKIPLGTAFELRREPISGRLTVFPTDADQDQMYDRAFVPSVPQPPEDQPSPCGEERPEKESLNDGG
jgi:hypothetical protein